MKVKLTPVGSCESTVVLENVLQITKVGTNAVYISQKNNKAIVGKTVLLNEMDVLVCIEHGPEGAER